MAKRKATRATSRKKAAARRSARPASRGSRKAGASARKAAKGPIYMLDPNWLMALATMFQVIYESDDGDSAVKVCYISPKGDGPV